MNIRYQADTQRKNTIARVMIDRKRKQDRIVPSIHEAAKIAGEFIAAKNNKESTKLEDVIKSYRPKFLKDRGEI